MKKNSPWLWVYVSHTLELDRLAFCEDSDFSFHEGEIQKPTPRQCPTNIERLIQEGRRLAVESCIRVPGPVVQLAELTEDDPQDVWIRLLAKEVIKRFFKMM